MWGGGGVCVWWGKMRRVKVKVKVRGVCKRRVVRNVQRCAVKCAGVGRGKGVVVWCACVRVWG